MNAHQLVKLARMMTGEPISPATKSELWLAYRVLEIVQGTSSGFMRAKPGKKVELDLDDKEPVA